MVSFLVFNFTKEFFFTWGGSLDSLERCGESGVSSSSGVRFSESMREIVIPLKCVKFLHTFATPT